MFELYSKKTATPVPVLSSKHRGMNWELDTITATWIIIIFFKKKGGAMTHDSYSHPAVELS